MTPASITLPGKLARDWTEPLSFLGCAGSSSGPCASGCQAPPFVDFQIPVSVPAKTVSTPEVRIARTFVVAGFGNPALKALQLMPPLVLRNTPPPSSPA